MLANFKLRDVSACQRCPDCVMVMSSTKRLIVVCEIENRDHFYITKRSRLHEMKDSIYTVKNMQEQDDTREKISLLHNIFLSITLVVCHNISDFRHPTAKCMSDKDRPVG